MNSDILAVQPAARANVLKLERAQHGEAFADHSGGGKKFAQHLHSRRTIAGFFFQFARGGDDVILTHVVIADQSCRQFNARSAQRNAELLDQQHVIINVDCQDHGSANTARASDIFPLAPNFGGEKAALPDNFFRRFGVAHHTSISRSGSSLTSFS